MFIFSTMALSDEDILKLIDLYRESTSLWDCTHSEYKNKNKRHDDLTEIANSFGVQKNEIEKKIKYLQSHFSRERKKEFESKTTGSGADETYESKWFAYKPLLFLANKHKPRKTVDNVKVSTDREGEENDRQEEGNEQGEKDPEVDLTEPSDAQEENNIKATTPTKTLERKEFKSSKKSKAKRSPTTSADAPIINEAVNLLKSIQSKRAVNRDEFTLFGEQVAMKLRRLNSPQSRFLAQNAINNTLFEAEIGMYEPLNEPKRFAQQHPQLPYNFNTFQYQATSALNSGIPRTYRVPPETTKSILLASSPVPSKSPSSGCTPAYSPSSSTVYSRSPSPGYSQSPLPDYSQPLPFEPSQPQMATSQLSTSNIDSLMRE